MCRLQQDSAARPARLLLALLVGLALGGRTESARAQENVPLRSNWQPLQQSLQTCRQTGKLLVVVTSSGEEPASKSFAATFKMVVDQASSELDMMFSEMPTEEFADALKKMRVTTHPTLILYRPGPRNVQLVASHSGFRTVREAVLWLDSIGALKTKTATASAPASDPAQTQFGSPPLPERILPEARSAATQRDQEVEKTSWQGAYGSDQNTYPSEQGNRPYPPPPQKVPPSVPPTQLPPPWAPPVQYQQVQQPPVYTGQVSTPLVVSPPSVPMVIQPQAPTVVVGPTPQPNIIFAAAPPAAPTISYMMTANAPQPTANAPQLFMANAPQPQPVAMAPQPQPMAMASQPQPMAMAPQPVQMAYAPQPVAAAPQPAQVAYAPQPAQVAQSPALLAAVLTNPSLVNRLLGALGEHLAQRKNPRIQMGQAPQMMQAPMAMAPMGNAPAGAMAYAPAGYGYGPAPGMMGYMAVPPGGPTPGYGYGYGYGPPPGQEYGPGPGYPQYPPQGPREGYYPPYRPQGPPPVAPTPQGYGPSWAGQGNNNSSSQLPPLPSGSQPERKSWLGGLFSK